MSPLTEFKGAHIVQYICRQPVSGYNLSLPLLICGEFPQ